MCRTETILNTKHRAIGFRDRQGPWGKEGRQRLYHRPVRKSKGRNPKRTSSGSSSLHLPQKQRLNLHFSHTILPRVVLSPQPAKQEQLPKYINNTAEKTSSSGYVSSLPYSALPLRPIQDGKSRGRDKREFMGGASFIGPPLLFNDWLSACESPPSGLRLREGPWQPVAPEGGRRWCPLPFGGRES